MENPLFSIILPIYNVGIYLRPCIESILFQTYRGYEIILVDDGSTDDSPQVCDEYADKYPMVKVCHQPNAGLSEARNSGLRLAVGEYVLFVDSDDYLIDNCVLEKLKNRIDIFHDDIIAYKFVKWFEDTDNLGRCTFNYDIAKPSHDFVEVGLQLTDKDSYYNSAWSKALRKALLVDNNINFTKGLLGEDNDWYFSVALHAKTISLIDEPLYVYRQRAGSITKTVTTKNLADILWIIDKWSTIISSQSENRSCAVIKANLAKQYCNAIICYSSIKNVDSYYPQLKKFRYLLSESRNKRVVIFRCITRLIGLKGLIFILGKCNNNAKKNISSNSCYKY